MHNRGENVAPVPIEDGLKALLGPCVSNCMVCKGEKNEILYGSDPNQHVMAGGRRREKVPELAGDPSP